MLPLRKRRQPLLISIFCLVNLIAFGQVTEQWVSKYSGAGNSSDQGRDIVVDKKGNVYVTGRSTSSTTGDYTTIKYSSEGKQLWVRTYDGPGKSEDIAVSVAVDDAGNVYVTGGSPGIGSGNDYATIKYDAEGNQLWVKRYNGPGNAYDVATSLTLDHLGNVYVTGIVSISENDTDYATIKYDNNGNELWVRGYHGTAGLQDEAISIASDKSGNVYVTGRSTNKETFSDYATIKYDASGNELWVKTYNGVANAADAARFIAVDEFGNSYVTGSATAYGTITDYATIKYDASGNTVWVKTYNGPVNHQDLATQLAIDELGNVYVTGWSSGDKNLYDYATIKYDANGNQMWVRRYNGPANSVDIAESIAVMNGNIYVTGGSGGLGNGDDFVTICYDAIGNELWLKRFDGAAHGFDIGYAVAADADGNCYVTGQTQGIQTGDDITTIKYGQPLPLKVDAGEDRTIYLGYGSNCTTLGVKTSGGNPPYSYMWSPTGSTASTISVCPSATTTYTVTVSDGDGHIASDRIKVNVVDVRCGNNKILVCHKGDKICISPNAVPAHLKHGDNLGPCVVSPGKDDCIGSPLQVFNTPNPFTNATRFQYELCESGRILIVVFDGTGRKVSTLVNGERKAGVYSIDSYGSKLHNGIYYYLATLITDRKVFVKTGKMVKVK